MAFSTGFQSVQKLNIRNLYSTNISLEHRTMKRKPEHQRKITRKPVYVNVTRNSQLISYEYIPEYKAYIPKAPAFRMVSDKKAKEITERLNTPRTRTPRPGTVPEIKSLHREPSSLEDQNLSVQRLSQPTVASFVRLRMSSGKENKMQVKEIANACERLYLPPSQRYFPEAYKNWLNIDGSRSLGSSFYNTNKSRSFDSSISWND